MLGAKFLKISALGIILAHWLKKVYSPIDKHLKNPGRKQVLSGLTSGRHCYDDIGRERYVSGDGYIACDKSQITNNKSGTPERTRRAIFRNPLEESDSLRLQII